MYILDNPTHLADEEIIEIVDVALTQLNAHDKLKFLDIRLSPYFLMKGLAWVDEGRIMLTFPRGFDPRNSVDRMEALQILHHEIDHLLGHDHDTMPKWWTLPVDAFDGYDFAVGQPEGLDKVDRRLLKKMECLERKVRQLVLKIEACRVSRPRKQGRVTTVYTSADTPLTSVGPRVTTVTAEPPVTTEPATEEE